MDSIKQPVDSSERLEAQMLPCSIATDDAIVDAESMDDITFLADASFDQDTSLDTLALELDSLLCSTPSEMHQLEITFEWTDVHLMHPTIAWQPAKPDVPMSVQPVSDVESEQGPSKEQFLEPP